MPSAGSQLASPLKIVLVVVASTLLFAGPALAYLDPASSTFILQTVVAGIFSALYFVKLNWLKLKSLFTGGRGNVSAAGKSSKVESPPQGERAEE